MKWIFSILLFVPLLVKAQQIVEICNNSKSYTYSTTSDIDGEIEWYVLGSYYYGNEITLFWDTPGIFTISVTATSNGCPSLPQTYTVTVKECDPILIWVPNTFTPNGDEFNTTWGPVVSGPVDLQDFHVMVFNRWGGIVWESYDADEKWDGMYYGKPVSDGVYIWKIDFGIVGIDERKEYHGHITIIR